VRAYSMDLRERVLADSDDGMKTRAVARKYRVSESWVRRLKQRRAATGETAPRPPRNRRVSFRDRHADRLRAAVAEKPDRTLAELRDLLGVRVGLGTLWQALTDLKLSWKKSRSGRPSGTART
jgi:transposase